MTDVIRRLDISSESGYEIAVFTASDKEARPSFEEAVRRVPFLDALPKEDLERLRPGVQWRRISRGEALWWEGGDTEEFSFLADGRIKLVKHHDDGREVIVDLCGPGQLLCSSAVYCSAPYCCSAVALENATEAVLVSRKALLELLETSTTASNAFLKLVVGRDMELSKRIQELAAGQVDRRIARLLLRLGEQLGSPREKAVHVPLVLSRQDLADLCGTTVETAIRVMSRFARQAVVRTLENGFSIIDPEALEAIARGEG